MINKFCWHLDHKSRRLLHFVQWTGIVRSFLLFNQNGVKILITLFWDTQYIPVYVSLYMNSKDACEKGSTFKPRTRSEPKDSLRRRAVHTQEHNKNKVRGEKIRKKTHGATCIQRWIWCSYKKTSKKGHFFPHAHIEKGVKNSKILKKRLCFQPLKLWYVFRV